MDLPRLELLIILALPLVAGIVVGLMGPQRGRAIRWIAAATTAATLLLTLHVAAQFMRFNTPRAAQAEKRVDTPTFRPLFVPGAPGVTLHEGNIREENPHGTSWNLLPLGPGNIQFFIGIDGINLWLVVLTAVLGVPVVLVSWNHISVRVNEFYAWLLILQTAMLGIFLSFDIILFYVFFELSLVPLFFLIGIWGGPERRYAAGKFFIYTLTGSLITLLGVLGVVFACYTKNNNELTFSIPRLVEIVHARLRIPNEEERQFWANVQLWVFLALTAGFAVKVPLVPFHTWLPLAHVEAPTAGSIDLAGVLLKVGAYGFLRLCVPLAPDVSLNLGLPLVSTLAVVGIIYGALCAYAQDDIKRLVAYSSVSHLGLCMLGMFALNSAGISGSIMQMINHGLSTSGLFLIVGMLYERYHTRKISDYGGMAARLPLFGVFMTFICMSSIGLPGLNGFIGELLSLMGVFEQQWQRDQFPIYAVIGAFGMFLGAWYLMTMLRRVFFGPLKEPPVPEHEQHDPITDLTGRELTALVPLAILCVVVGLYPQPMLDTMRPDVKVIEDIAGNARKRVVLAAQRGPAVVENDRGEGAAP
ncbi:MAG: NADH-quinone oxidoreductase subunit M [Gemmataceae bacterium]|nr:NADH-quinone oxidoreductase subunit M [Gemmataceae bacterium]